MTAPPKPRRGPGKPSLSGEGRSPRIPSTSVPESVDAAVRHEADRRSVGVGQVVREVLTAWADRRRSWVYPTGTTITAKVPPEADSNAIAAAAIKTVRQLRAEGLDPQEITLTADGKPVGVIPIPRGRF